MSAVMAARLLRGHRVRMSRAIARQIHQLVPKYRNVDEMVLERTIATLLVGVEERLEHGDDTRLFETLQTTIELRAITGFNVSEFLIACLCYLPVARRFLLERCATVDEALRAYDEIEAVALPLMGRIVALFEHVTAEAAQDGERRPEDIFAGFLKSAGTFAPARIEKVTGDDSLEDE